MATTGVHPHDSLRSGNIADDLARKDRPLHVVVVSPARPIYEGEAHHLSVESLKGQMGIWQGHADIVAALGTGALTIHREQGKPDRFAISGGFLKVGGRSVTILVDKAVAAADLDAAEAKRELDRALEGLRHPKSDEAFEALLADRSWAQARLALGHAPTTGS